MDIPVQHTGTLSSWLSQEGGFGAGYGGCPHTAPPSPGHVVEGAAQLWKQKAGFLTPTLHSRHQDRLLIFSLLAPKRREDWHGGLSVEEEGWQGRGWDRIWGH